MNVSPAKVEKILTGHYKFANLGFALLITSIRSKYLRDSSPVALANFTAEINAFIDKNKNSMAQDIKSLGTV